MKKAVIAVLSIVLILSLTACGHGDTSLWQANDVFEDVVVYSYGDTIQADFATSCNIKVKDNSYKNFVKYINDLKDKGFTFVADGDIPENYNLADGQATWQCTNGSLYLMLIFSEDGSSSYNQFGCNVQIYGYSTRPAWAGKEKPEEASSEKTTDAAEETEASATAK